MVLNSVMLAVGLAFESFIVALANGLKNANMRLKTACLYAFIFAAFHAVALFIGYAVVKTVAENIDRVEKILSVAAIVVLLFLGVKMIVEGVKRGEEKSATGLAEFSVQSAVAAMDAVAAGFTVPDYGIGDTAFCAAVIATVILAFFLVGFVVGKKFGNKLSRYAAILGGLVFIGLAVEVAVGLIFDLP